MGILRRRGGILYRLSAAAPTNGDQSLPSFSYTLTASKASGSGSINMSELSMDIYQDSFFSQIQNSYALNNIAIESTATNVTFSSPSATLVTVPAGVTRYFELRGAPTNIATDDLLMARTLNLPANTFVGVAPPPPPSPQCSDSIDNDGDTKIDYPQDPGCTDTLDNDETDPTPPPPPPPGGTFNDDFNRADSPTLDNGWTEVAGDLRILSNSLQDQSATGFNRAIQSTLVGSTQTVAADFTKVGDSQGQFGILFRYQNAQNYYMIYRTTGSSNRVNISKFVNGVETVLKYYVTSNPSLGVPFRLEGRVNGSTLTAHLNGSQLISASDTTFSTGALGLYLGHGRGTNPQKADNFGATVAL